MLAGTTIEKMGNATFNSPEFARGDLFASFGMNAVGKKGNTTLTIEVEDRNSEDTSWNLVGTLFTVSATGTQENSIGPVQEIVRFKYSFSGGADGDGYHIVMGPPSWRSA